MRGLPGGSPSPLYESTPKEGANPTPGRPLMLQQAIFNSKLHRRGGLGYGASPSGPLGIHHTPRRVTHGWRRNMSAFLMMITLGANVYVYIYDMSYAATIS